MAHPSDIAIGAEDAPRRVWVERRSDGRTNVVFWMADPTLPSGFTGWNVYRSPQPCSDITSPSMVKLNAAPLGVAHLLDPVEPLGVPSYLVTQVTSAGEQALDRPVQVGDTSDPERQGRGFPIISMPRVFAEIRRRRQLVLGPTAEYAGVGTGEVVVVLVRRLFGKRCPKCFQGGYEAGTRADCPGCWGTGWDRGYERVDSVQMRIDNVAETLRATPPGGLEFNSAPKAWLVGFPLLRQGDVVVRPTVGKRYEAQGIGISVHQGILTGQSFDLLAYEPKHPIYGYPI